MIKKVLITGGSGFFGENLVSKLISKGYICSVLDLNSPDKSLTQNIVFHQVDIRDKKKVIKCCKDINIVIHCVAQVPLAKNKDLFQSVNYEGTRNILDAAKLNNCEHFIYLSSSAVYGVPDFNPINELSNTNPCEDYGKAKLDGEHLVNKFNKDGLNTTIIRPRTILGNGRLGIFQILFEWIYKGKNIPVFDKGVNTYQFIHSNDLVDSIILCCKKNAYGIYNIGAEEYCSMHETLSELIIHSKSKSKIKSLNSNFVIPIMNLFSMLGLSPLASYHAKMYGKSIYFDISKSKKELNWNAKYSNIEMIKESYDWYIKNRNKVLKSKGNSQHKSIVKQRILYFFSKIF